MKWEWFIGWLLIGAAAFGEVRPEEVEGNWDFEKARRKYAVSAVMREAENRYPSFWAGEPKGGTLAIATEKDLLGDSWVGKVSGKVTFQLTRAAAKTGMEQRIPAGTWSRGLKERPVKLVIDRFGGFEPEPPNKKAKGPVLSGDVSGTLTGPDNAGLPMKGRLTFAFAKGQSRFNLSAKLVVEKLPGSAKPVTIELAMPGDMAKLDPKLPSF